MHFFNQAWLKIALWGTAILFRETRFLTVTFVNFDGEMIFW